MSVRGDPPNPIRTHCTIDDLIDFVSEVTTEGSRRVEAHVPDCARCADLLGQALRYNLLVENWTTERAAELSWRLAIVKAFEDATLRPENRSWAGALTRWAKEFSGHVQAALGIRLDSPGEGSLSFSAVDKGFLSPGAWEFVPAVMAGIGAIRIAEIRGVPDARVELRTASSGSKGVGPSLAITLPASVGPGSGQRLVMLVPWNLTERATVQQMTRQSGGLWSAEFTDLEQGRYLIVVEPGSDPGTKD
jgi:hypothetical protein